MFHRLSPLFGLTLAGLLAGCTLADIPETRIGVNRPAPGAMREFIGPDVRGAAAYHVVLTLDRAGTSPVGVSGFNAQPRISLKAVAWREGHPRADRAYFWTMRALDRPDPQGLLLTNSEPREFQLLPGEWPLDSTAPAPTESAATAAPTGFWPF